MVNANLRSLDFSGEGQNRIREAYTKSLIISVSYFCENKDLKQICQNFKFSIILYTVSLK